MSKNKKDLETGEHSVVMRMILDEVLKKVGMTRYRLAKEKLNQQPNSLTPWGKEGFDPKLSSVVKIAKITNRDVNDFFVAEGYEPVAERIAKALNCTVEDLLSGEYTIVKKKA